MEFAFDVSGTSTAMVKKYQVAATNNVLGVPYLRTAGAGTGLVLGTTTGVANAVGVNIDTAGTYVTAQQSDNSDTSRLTSIIINPGAVYKMLMSGGATNGTALTLYPVTTASTDGLAITTASEWSSPTYDEGTAWGYDGANAGKVRKITSVSSTAGTVIVAFPYDTAVGDNFLRAPWNPTQTITLQLTTTLDQADASIAVGSGGAWDIVELLCGDIGSEGRTNSYVFAMFQDHIFGGAVT